MSSGAACRAVAMAKAGDISRYFRDIQRLTRSFPAYSVSRPAHWKRRLMQVENLDQADPGHTINAANDGCVGAAR